MKIKILNEDLREVITEIPYYKDLKKYAYTYSVGRNCFVGTSTAGMVESVNFCVRKNPDEFKWDIFGALSLCKVAASAAVTPNRVVYEVYTVLGRNRDSCFLGSFVDKKDAIDLFDKAIRRLRNLIDLDGIGDNVTKFKKTVKAAILKVNSEMGED